MKWNGIMIILTSLEPGDIIAIVSVSIALGSAILALYSLYRAKKENEAQLAGSILKAIQTCEVRYRFEYAEKWYSDDFHESDLEPSMDSFLSTMNYICFLKDKGLINEKTMKVFEYYLDRVAKNDDCRCYLWNLYHFGDPNKEECAFYNLVCYVRGTMDEKTLQAFESEEESGIFFKNKEFK